MRDGLSDPVSDARLVARVLREQWQELERRREEGAADLLRFYRYCFQGATDLGGAWLGGSGLAAVFAGLRAQLPGTRTALAIMGRLWSGKTFASVAPRLALDHLAVPGLRPVAAYASAWVQVAGAQSVLPP